LQRTTFFFIFRRYFPRPGQAGRGFEKLRQFIEYIFPHCFGKKEGLPSFPFSEFVNKIWHPQPPLPHMLLRGHWPKDGGEPHPQLTAGIHVLEAV
jgi:hypothetical protein